MVRTLPESDCELPQVLFEVLLRAIQARRNPHALVLPIIAALSLLKLFDGLLKLFDPVEKLWNASSMRDDA